MVAIFKYFYLTPSVKNSYFSANFGYNNAADGNCLIYVLSIYYVVKSKFKIADKSVVTDCS